MISMTRVSSLWSSTLFEPSRANKIRLESVDLVAHGLHCVGPTATLETVGPPGPSLGDVLGGTTQHLQQAGRHHTP